MEFGEHHDTAALGLLRAVTRLADAVADY